jgi:hypothetical protein
MDTDPILSRIVNGDDRKLQGNFYMRFAEAIALPLLALGSSVLPGGAGRLLELAQSLFNHAQYVEAAVRCPVWARLMASAPKASG